MTNPHHIDGGWLLSLAVATVLGLGLWYVVTTGSAVLADRLAGLRTVAEATR